MYKKQLTALCLLTALLLSGCKTETIVLSTENTVAGEVTAATQNQTSIPEDSSVFSARDYETEYDDTAVQVYLTGSSANASSNAVQVSGSTVKLTTEGTYVLSGDLAGILVVDAPKTDKLHLVLCGVNITNSTGAAIYILQADKVFITLDAGTENFLTGGEEFVAIDENNIDAVLYSKEDLTLNGTGSLTVTSPAGHGIISKDDLVITGGSYTVTTAGQGIGGKDSVRIADGSFTIQSGTDGIHADNDEDTSLGYAYLAGGSYSINAQGDGISASATLQIHGGSYTVTAGGGSENSTKTSSDSYGQFQGGGMGGHGGMGGMGGMNMGGSGFSSTQTTDDSTSMKGVKATGDILLTGGSFTINSADDAVHSNSSITVSGGNFNIATGDDGMHADTSLTITSGSITVTESYEGLEAQYLTISGGDIYLVTTDDGLNAAGGTDSSGTGGRDNGMFGGMGMGGMSSGNGSILISGGTLYINASGDGIDANGTLEISGGHTTVCGPTQGDTATLDYDKTGIITGGTFLGTGAANMAQTFSDSQQGVIAVSVGNQAAGTQIVLTDESGNTVLTHSPELNFSVAILSSPDIVKGQTYTITVGSASGTFEAG